MYETRIGIGGFLYSISCEDGIRLDGSLDPFLAPFLKGDCVMMSLRLKRVLSPPYVRVNEVIFETDSTWGLYNKRSKVLTIPPLKGGNPRIVAEFDSGFRNGMVYIYKDGENYLLYPFLEVLTINLLSMGKGVLLHACCVDDNGKGYIFAGPSGAGKSTMANLWKGRKGVRVLSDDRVILRGSDKGLMAYGTPWYGSANAIVADSVVVKRIFFIRHAKENKATPIKGVRSILELVTSSFLPFWDRDGVEYSMRFLSQVEKEGNLFCMGFLPEDGVVDLVRGL